MDQKIEDDEIEQHLIKKIDYAIKHLGEQNNLVTKCYSFDFEGLKKILEDPTKEIHGDVRRDNLYYLNNLLTEWKIIKKHSSFSAVEDREACLNIKKSLKTMKKDLKVEESSSRGDLERSVSRHQEPNHRIFERNKNEVYRWSSRHGPKKVHGFEHRVMAIERELVMRNIDAPFKVLGVVGVAGIGKTTLCQTIFGQELVKKHFSPRIWVCLSKQPSEDGPKQDENNDIKKPEEVDVKKPKEDDGKKPKGDDVKQPKDPKQPKEILVRILENLGIEDEVIRDAGNGSDGNGLRRLILLLRLQLIGKRYLIVLDDAWNHDEFFLNLTQKEQLDENWGEELAYALPKGCGGSVISSSRSDALLKKMLGKDVSLQYLKPYADKENEIIYKIFKDTVIGYDKDMKELPQHLQDLKKEILKKCDGIPLTAKLLAQIAQQQMKGFKKQPPATSAGIVHEEKSVPASGDEQLKGGGGAVQDGEHKSDLLPKSKHKSGLPPVGSDQMAETAGEK